MRGERRMPWSVGNNVQGRTCINLVEPIEAHSVLGRCRMSARSMNQWMERLFRTEEDVGFSWAVRTASSMGCESRGLEGARVACQLIR